MFWRKVILSASLLPLVVIGIITIPVDKSQSRLYSADPYEDTTLRIGQLNSSKEYLRASLASRKKKMAELLEQLESEGMIRDVVYDDESHLFQFFHANGLKNSIMLDAFDPYRNGN